MEDSQFAEAVASLQTDKDGAIDFAKMQGKLKGAPVPKSKAQPPKLPEPSKRQKLLRTRLEQLLELDKSQVSMTARGHIKELLELFDRAKRVDGNIALLKEKDFQLQKSITKDFDQVSLILRGKPPRTKKKDETA